MDILLGQYKGLKATIPYIAYTDDDIIHKLPPFYQETLSGRVKKARLRWEIPQLLIMKDLRMMFRLMVEKPRNIRLVSDQEAFIPGFEEQIVGMQIGDSRDINLSFPEQYHAPDLAGKEVVFKVKLHDIYTEKPAELNDEFAVSLEIPGVSNVDELKASYRRIP